MKYDEYYAARPADIGAYEEKRTGGKPIYDGVVLHVVRDEILLPDGKPGVREVVRHPGAVAVVPLTREGEVVCVRQFRYPNNGMLLEIPAGKLEPGERERGFTAGIENAARRELREETGAVSGKLTYIGQFLSSPAILDEIIYLFLAEDLSFGETDPDDDEFIDVVRVPLGELCAAIADGRVTDGKTQAAVLKADYILRGRKN